MAVSTVLSLRADEYIDKEHSYVDIHQCIPGAHARAIKPGGIHTIKHSIMDNGYKRVTNQNTPRWCTYHFPRLRLSSIGVDDQCAAYG
jgi:hypothetical protein